MNLSFYFLTTSIIKYQGGYQGWKQLKYDHDEPNGPYQRIPTLNRYM